MKETLENLEFEHLPKLSQFVISLNAYNPNFGDVKSYTDFIIQPLVKGMFVPCSEEGEALEEMSLFGLGIKYPDYSETALNELFRRRTIEYQQAKDRVLFSFTDFEMCPSGTSIYYSPRDYYIDFLFDTQTIEQAINNGVKLILK